MIVSILGIEDATPRGCHKVYPRYFISQVVLVGLTKGRLYPRGKVGGRGGGGGGVASWHP